MREGTQAAWADPEKRARIVAAIRDPENLDKIAAAARRQWSEEKRAQLSIALLGNKYATGKRSPQTTARMSAAAKRRWAVYHERQAGSADG